MDPVRSAFAAPSWGLNIFKFSVRPVYEAHFESVKIVS